MWIALLLVRLKLPNNRPWKAVVKLSALSAGAPGAAFFMQLAISSSVNPSTFSSPRSRARYAMKAAFKAPSFAHDPHICVNKCGVPAGATERRPELMVWAHSLWGNEPKAGRFMAAMANSSVLASASKSGLLYPTGMEALRREGPL